MGEAAVEDRLSSLEIVLESFIMSTHVMIREIKNENAKMKQDTAKFKENMDKTITEMKQDTAKFKENMDKTITEMKQDTAKFKENMDKTITEMKQDTAKFKENMDRTIIDIKQTAIKMEQDTIKMKKELNKQWGDLANKMGTIVEDIVAPNIAGIARQYFQVEEFAFFAIRVKCQSTINHKVVREFDVIAVSNEFFFINETKSTVKMSYVNDFIDALKNIYEYFPQNREKKLIPIFSALHIPYDIQNYLTKHNIYAMSMKDDTMDLINFEEIMRNDGFVKNLE
ncbi:MAG: hypothetical protein HQK62_05055 [Desulfamplus sp.]|nr:hypothetical protein [Desulfamplus sp.]